MQPEQPSGPRKDHVRSTSFHQDQDQNCMAQEARSKRFFGDLCSQYFLIERKGSGNKGRGWMWDERNDDTKH